MGLKHFISLRDSHEIQEVLKRGRKYTSTHFVYFYLPTPQPPFKLAVAIKRNWDKAVYRNQTRRRIREWARLQSGLAGRMLIAQKAKFENKTERRKIRMEIATVFGKIQSHA